MRFVILFLWLLLAACNARQMVESDDLTASVRSGDVARVNELLACGTDPNRPVGVNGWSPLMHAVHKNQLRTAEALLQHAADVDRSAPDGMTPLMMAAGYGNDTMVALLLRHGADPERRSHDGATALDFALTGVTDIDEFTLFRCQASTVALLSRHHAAMNDTLAASRLFAAVKRCR